MSFENCVRLLQTVHYSKNFFFFFDFFAISRAASVAYGGSQARGLIGAIVAGLYQGHSYSGSKPRLQPTPQLMATQDPSHVCDTHHSSWQCQILNSLIEARDGTRNLIVPSWILSALPQQEVHVELLYLYFS